MAHKVRIDLKFDGLEEYQTLKNWLDRDNIKLDNFVSFCVNTVWNQLLDEALKHAKKESMDEFNSSAIVNNPAGIPVSDSFDSSESEIGNADSAQEG